MEGSWAGALCPPARTLPRSTGLHRTCLDSVASVLREGLRPCVPGRPGQVGALVWGSVRRIESFGLFLGLDNLRVSGLLHISNMSRAHVEDPSARPRAPLPSCARRVGSQGAAEPGSTRQGGPDVTTMVVQLHMMGCACACVLHCSCSTGRDWQCVGVEERAGKAGCDDAVSALLITVTIADTMVEFLDLSRRPRTAAPRSLSALPLQHWAERPW